VSAENRQWTRHPTLSLATMLQAPDGGVGGFANDVFLGCVLDISLGGVGMRCTCQPEVGTNLWIRIDLEGESLEALAEVVHADPSSRSVGLLFTRLCRPSFAVLHRFVRHQGAGRSGRSLPPALELSA
jgi:hypothetical protein